MRFIKTSSKIDTKSRFPQRMLQTVAQPKIEQWNDVPPASVDYGAARDSLQGHIKKLVAQLSNR